jgi:uncharacterized protein (TIGR02117 family)
MHCDSKLLRRVKRIMAIASLTLLVVLAVGCIIPTRWQSAQRGCDVPLIISSVNHFHAELIVPVKAAGVNWAERIDLNALGKQAQAYQYLSFGWGDRDFFLRGSFDPITIGKALFWPTPTVMHVWGHTQPPLSTLKPRFELKQQWLSAEEYQQLADFIWAGFEPSATEQPIFVRSGLYPNSAFFTGTGSYSILRTCNIWTAEGLRVAQRKTPQWPALAPVLMAHLEDRPTCRTPGQAT